jgi:hypothetical protein
LRAGCHSFTSVSAHLLYLHDTATYCDSWFSMSAVYPHVFGFAPLLGTHHPLGSRWSVRLLVSHTLSFEDVPTSHLFVRLTPTCCTPAMLLADMFCICKTCVLLSFGIGHGVTNYIVELTLHTTTHTPPRGPCTASKTDRACLHLELSDRKCSSPTSLASSCKTPDYTRRTAGFGGKDSSWALVIDQYRQTRK